MLGFVSIARAVLSPPPTIAPPLSLEQEIRALGLAVIPLERVRAYQRRTVCEYEMQGSHYHARWEKVSSTDFSVEPPAGVKLDMARAATIPNTKIYTERFLEDPFVFISRQRKNQPLEVVCFVYWDAPGFVA